MLPNRHIGIVAALLAAAVALLANCGRQSAPPKQDVTPPSVISEYPENGKGNVDVNTVIVVTFSEPIAGSSITAATFKVSDQNNGTVDGDVTLTNGSTAKFTPRSSLQYSVTYFVTIQAGVQDTSGNVMTSTHSFAFTTGELHDTTPPWVAATNPDGSARVGINENISVSFSERMNEETITPASFAVSDGAAGVPGTITSYEGKTFVFTSATGTLRYSTTYSVTIGGTVTDLAGNHLADAAGNPLASYAWSFRTQDPAPDVTPPFVLSTVPAGGAQNVSRNLTTIIASFNEMMLASTITGTTFVLSEQKSGALVSGDVEASGATAVFTPSAPLKYLTTYLVTLVSGSGRVTDLAGNPVVPNSPGAYLWSFETEALPTNMLTITRTGTGNGTVTVSTGAIVWSGNTGTAVYDYNTLVTLTANASTGSSFSGWTGEGCAGTGTCTVTMSAARNVSAGFTLNSYLLTVTKAGTGGGSVNANAGTLSWAGNTGTASYDYNTQVTLSAISSADSTFTGWSGEGCSGTGTCPVTMTAARSVTATFTLIPINGACGTSNNGTFTVAPTANLCSTGNASAVSGPGPWTWDCTGLYGGSTASCSANIQTYTVSATAGTGGTIDPASRVVNHGATATFTVTPSAEYSIAAVTGCGGTLANNTYTTGAITAACTVSATFTQNPVNGACGSSNNGTFTVAPTTNLCSTGNASAVRGLGPWTWDCTGLYGGSTASCSANIQTYTVSATAGTGGTIDPASRVVNHGATTTFTVTPSVGFSIAAVTGCGGALANNTYTTGAITAACTVAATFTQNPVNGACGSSNNGTFTVAPTTNLCSTGNASVVRGLGPWTWDCTGLYGGSTASCSANIQTYTVTTSAGAGGAIDPASVVVNHGFATTLSVAAGPGYYITSVSGCGGADYANGDTGVTNYNYTTGTVTANCQVTASFGSI